MRKIAVISGSAGTSQGRRYNGDMAKIDASRISTEALAELRAGRSVRLVKSGRTIATLRAQHARTAADAARELAVLRAADRDDDWAEYAAWPKT